MKRLEVKSSNIKSIGYENGILEVEFTTGMIYQYNKVPENIWTGLQVAESKGKFFHSNIIMKYETVKVETIKTVKPSGEINEENSNKS